MEKIQQKNGLLRKFLLSLRSNFESLVLTLEENKDISIYHDESQSSLINHEHRINLSNTSLEGAFTTQLSIRRGRGMGTQNSRGRGRIFSRGGCNNNPVNVSSRGKTYNGNPSGHSFNRSKIKCHYYNKFCHHAYECWNKQYK